MTTTTKATGGCICGGVRYEVTDQTKLRPVVAYHFIAVSGTQHKYFTLLNQATLHGYTYIPDVKQGFCGECGCSLFFDYPKEPRISIAAGSLDNTDNVTLAAQIYCAEAGDYYHLHPEGEMLNEGEFSLKCPN